MMRSILLGLLLMAAFNVPVVAQELTETQVALVMDNAIGQMEAKNYQEALAGFLTVGENTKKQRTKKERQLYINSQMKAVECYQSLKQYEKAYLLSKSLLDGKTTDEQKKELNHLFVQNGYHAAEGYTKEKRYAEMRAALEDILPIADEKDKHDIADGIAASWYFEGGQHLMAKKYNQALACMEKARDCYHNIGEVKNEISALSRIGDIKYSLYDFKGAIDAYEEAVASASSIKESTLIMSNLGELLQLYDIIGDSKEVLKTEARMDSLVSASNDEELKFKFYNFQGDRATVLGDYNTAELCYWKNYEYISKLGNDYEGGNKVVFYNKISNLYSKTKNYDEALKYTLLSKTETQNMVDKNNSGYYFPYILVADRYASKGDSVRCFENLDTLFASIYKFEDPLEKRYPFIMRGNCYSKFNNYEKALENFKAADNLLTAKYGEDYADRISGVLPYVAKTELQLGNYEEAERLYRQYAEGIRKLQGENSLSYIDALGYYANSEAFAGHLDAACNDYVLAVNKLKEQTRQKFLYLRTNEREGYWSKTSELIENMTPFALEAKECQSPFTQSCYDGLVLSKGFLLGTERSTYELVKAKGSKEDLRDYLLIVSMQAKIRGWEKDKNTYSDSILSTTQRCKQLETRLADRCRSYGDMASFMNIDYEKVKESLGSNDVLIDFTDFVHKSRGRVYAAYLVDKAQEFPLLQELFAESTIDSMQVDCADQYYQNPYSKRMLELLWTPFKDCVKEGATVYYVPTQLLFQIALESLPTEDGTLLGEHYNFVRLSSAREIVNHNPNLSTDAPAGKRDAVLYGGLLYDLNDDEMRTEAEKYDISSLMAVRGNSLQGDTIYYYLPGTKKEVDFIESLLKSHGIDVTPYTGKLGTEESFLSMSGRAPKVLHLATHGFYYTPKEAQEIDYLKGYKDAMMLSGLVLSGGNAAWQGHELPQGVLGGILTASNIARLDLSDNELTVLSACHSGSGEATSEGLFGLQRAFKKAGVKTIVMSLWDVNDEVTTAFMSLFYQNILDKETLGNKRAAFEKAKSAIREKYPEPYYWAGFVMLD